MLFRIETDSKPLIIVNGRPLSVVTLSYNWTTRTSMSPGIENCICAGYFKDELTEQTDKAKLHTFMYDVMLDILEEF